MPNVITRGCPKDNGDLVYDLDLLAYKCQTCDYQQRGLGVKPRDLVVVPAQNPPDLVAVADLARDIGISQAGVQSRIEKLGVPYRDLDGRRAITVDQAEKVKAWVARRPESNGHALATVDSPKPTPNGHAAPESAPVVRSVRLASGGTIAVSVANIAWLSLTPADRALVFGIVDLLNAHATAAEGG